MTRFSLVFTILLLSSMAVSRVSRAADDPLPKPAARAGNPVAGLKSLPPFFGMFGSAEFIARNGFRSKPGSFIEYALDDGSGQHMRIAEVGPAVEGARWFEITATVPDVAGSQGMKILTRGEKNGNIERFIVHVGGMPPMELPMEAVSGAAEGGVTRVAIQLAGVPRSLGHEKIETPLGQFMTEHFVLEPPADAPKGKKVEMWITKDSRVPFIGVVKMRMPTGMAVAAKVGTDAQSQITAPDRGG